MFVGHYALGLAAKKSAPDVPLAWLLAAPQLPDLLWPIFLLTGLETVRIEPGNTAFTPLDFLSYPWSHSLVMVCVWGALAAFLYRAIRSDGRGAAVIFALVVSHWVLDFATHRPDMPLAPWSGVKVGLGLWRSVPATLAVESALFAAGVAIYARATRARDRIGVFAFAALVLFLAVMYFGAAFGPPPPDVRTLAWGSLLLWFLPLWGWWIERHRVTVEA